MVKLVKYFVGLRAQIIYWALDLGREHEWSKDKQMVMNGSDPRLNEQDANGKVVQGGIFHWI